MTEEELENEYKDLEQHRVVTDHRSSSLESEIFWYRALAIFLIVLGFIAFLIPITKIPNLNEFGDYVGGVVSSLWSLAGLLFIYVAFLGQKQQLLIQQHELRHTQYETKATRFEIMIQGEQMRVQNDTLKQQRFENTFFELLKTFNDIIENIVLFNQNSEILNSGRPAFKNFYSFFSDRVREYKIENQSGEVAIAYRSGDSKMRDDIIFETILSVAEIDTIYKDFFMKYQDSIGHYFRTLYHILRYVDETDLVNDKKKYTRIVRAQLSVYELLLLFYNCISSYGSTKHKPLLVEYSMFKNLKHPLLSFGDHSLYNSKAFGA